MVSIQFILSLLNYSLKWWGTSKKSIDRLNLEICKIQFYRIHLKYKGSVKRWGQRWYRWVKKWR